MYLCKYNISNLLGSYKQTNCTALFAELEQTESLTPGNKSIVILSLMYRSAKRS